MKIAVIGGGPGGYVAAIRAAQLGAEVTLIEKESRGGTCLNLGCIPTKCMLHSAEIYEMVKGGADIGVIAEPRLDFPAAMAYKQNIINMLTGGVKGLLKINGVNIIKGIASFAGSDILDITTENRTETCIFDRIIIATGSVPAKIPFPGFDNPQCIDSTGALTLEKVPASMVIIGGGVIGIEMATVYNSFGTKITIVEMLPKIMAMMDGEMADLVQSHLEWKGVKIYTSAKVVSVEDCGKTARVHVEINNEANTFEGEKVLICTGRRTNTEALDLEKSGIIADKGRIIVDEFMQTNIPGVYAVGDCLGRTMLAHVASAQAEIAAENAMGHAVKYDEKTNPSCVYTDPEFASVGITEEQAKREGIRYIIGKFPLAGNGKALIINRGEGMIKIMANKENGKILAVHILGPRATDLIAEGALAIRLGATVDEFITTIHAHPTISEAVREAALSVQNRAIHKDNRLRC